ncbi:hypothetical protein EYF80_003439 [Liparis tanakae]|uniref:Uncharacterized protein n=1 Tax=Liparis tanakae TaxID=230148 RepID=A0A4Z2J981_9TELE|nr:hypothetical protein EYF80_003439 [Liparis tanakae]
MREENGGKRGDETKEECEGGFVLCNTIVTINRRAHAETGSRWFATPKIPEGGEGKKAPPHYSTRETVADGSAAVPR